MKLKLLKNEKHPFRFYIFIGVFVIFVAYIVFSIGSVYKQVKDKQAQYNDIQNQIKIQELKNSELQHVLAYSDEEYLEYVINKLHNDLDYVRQGERVFINSAGN